jgi:hypothetical protein
MGLPGDGLCFEGEWMWRLPRVTVVPLHAPLWVGFGESFSYCSKSRPVEATIDGQPIEDASRNAYLGLFSLQARVAMPIHFGGAARRFFVTPELGAGALLDFYSTRALAINDELLTQPDHAGAAFVLEPTLQAGYSWGPLSAGAQVSYLAAWGDFGRLGGQVQTFYAGAFLRFNF